MQSGTVISPICVCCGAGNPACKSSFQFLAQNGRKVRIRAQCGKFRVPLDIFQRISRLDRPFQKLPELDFVTRNAPQQSGAIFQADFDEYVVEVINLIQAIQGSGVRVEDLVVQEFLRFVLEAVRREPLFGSHFGQPEQEPFPLF